MVRWHHQLSGHEWVNSRSWWWTGRPGVLRFMGWQRVGQDWVTELNWTTTFYHITLFTYYVYCSVSLHQNMSSMKAGILVYLSTAAAAVAAKSLQSYPTLCDPLNGSPPGSTVPGILQARILEWVAIAFSNLSTIISLISETLPNSQQISAGWINSLIQLTVFRNFTTLCLPIIKCHI